MQPAVNYIDDGFFTHDAGRGFIYSALLLLIANNFGFEYIVLFQKLMLMIIYLMSLIITLNIIKGIRNINVIIKNVFSILLLISYVYLVFNGPLIALTYTVMPEITFSFLITSLIFLVIQEKFIESKKVKSLILFFIYCIVIILPLIKPHFLLASIGFGLFYIFTRKLYLKKYILFTIAFALFIGSLAHLYEKNLQYKYDSYKSVVFGPLSLFCNNANLIYPYFENKSKNNFELVLAEKLKQIVDAGPHGG